jgi:NDP-sugar pyrophosphorylase family protein
MNMKPTLLILAAGMASRYGSMKQTEGFGPGSETIMDYSIYDAIKAGFGKVVFIIRKDFADSFKERFGNQLEGKIEVDYVFQELDAHTGEFTVPQERTKPWGTGHAVLCAASVIHEPFAVINADDYYGTEAFVQAADFLMNKCDEHTYAIIGYRLGNTLSEHGTVSRGVCEVNEAHELVSVKERTKIFRSGEKVIYESDGMNYEVNQDSSVSMNFWCFHPNIFHAAKSLFTQFLELQGKEQKSEFFIPIIAESFISDAVNKILVIPTESQWFGVTYKEDAPGVKQKIDRLIEEKIYPYHLWK